MRTPIKSRKKTPVSSVAIAKKKLFLDSQELEILKLIFAKLRIEYIMYFAVVEKKHLVFETEVMPVGAILELDKMYYSFTWMQVSLVNNNSEIRYHLLKYFNYCLFFA